MRTNNRPESIFMVGITGGSCAGKSTFARLLRNALGADYCHILSIDSYYRDQSQRFDHPNNIDFDLLYEHLLKLQQGKMIDVPISSRSMYPADIILLEGALILTQPKIVALLSECVFLDMAENIRLQRRIACDMSEHCRTREEVLAQFYDQIKPIHDQFIEPTKSLATYCIDNDLNFDSVIADIVDKLGVDS